MLRESRNISGDKVNNGDKANSGDKVNGGSGSDGSTLKTPEIELFHRNVVVPNNEETKLFLWQ